MSKKGIPGAVAFESYYASLFGERWPRLRAALLEPVNHLAWDRGLVKPYFMDSGSVEAALTLPPVSDGKALDMCAAPGGKSLVLASALEGDSTLTSNEFSRDRKNRLVAVLDQHLPPETRAKVTVTCRDAARWSRYEQDAFDRILLDAPCSSERHVLSSPAYLDEWSPARIRHLAARQWALLSGAFLVLREGGFLVYSTCALSPRENDEVVGKLLRKYERARVRDPYALRPSASSVSGSELTEFGRHVLPDTARGSGPLYFSLIEKIARTELG